MTTENIENHMAYTCKCGGVNFALLKSGGIECNKCSSQLDGVKWWAGGMGAQLARAIKAEAERDALQAKLDTAIQSSAHWQHQCTELQAKLSAMEKQEPVAWLYWDANAGSRGFYKVDPLLPHTEGAFPVYTAPKVAPLTDEQIDEIQQTWIGKGMKGSRSFARAIEKAHGIGGQPAPKVAQPIKPTFAEWCATNWDGPPSANARDAYNRIIGGQQL